MMSKGHSQLRSLLSPQPVTPLSHGLLLVVPWAPQAELTYLGCTQDSLLAPVPGRLCTLPMARSETETHIVQPGGNHSTPLSLL